MVSVCPTIGGSNPGLRAELIHSIKEKLSLICGCALTTYPSTFASVSVSCFWQSITCSWMKKSLYYWYTNDDQLLFYHFWVHVGENIVKIRNIILCWWFLRQKPNLKANGISLDIQLYLGQSITYYSLNKKKKEAKRNSTRVLHVVGVKSSILGPFKFLFILLLSYTKWEQQFSYHSNICPCWIDYSMLY